MLIGSEKTHSRKKETPGHLSGEQVLVERGLALKGDHCCQEKEGNQTLLYTPLVLSWIGQQEQETLIFSTIQVDDKQVDLPHWVLSAMKCLANWPKQMRTANGKESGLPNYTGFENDVFNVVKDYFLGLPGPLTTYPLYEFFVDAFIKAEALSTARSRQTVVQRVSGPPPCGQPMLYVRPCCRPEVGIGRNSAECGSHPSEAAQFYQMADDGRSEEEFPGLLSSQERVARIKQTFEVLAPLATSSVQNTYSSSSSTFLSSGHSTFDTVSPPSLSPDMSATAIMKNFLPPNSCFETAFMQESPITREDTNAIANVSCRSCHVKLYLYFKFF